MTEPHRIAFDAWRATHRNKYRGNQPGAAVTAWEAWQACRKAAREEMREEAALLATQFNKEAADAIAIIRREAFEEAARVCEAHETELQVIVPTKIDDTLHTVACRACAAAIRALD